MWVRVKFDGQSDRAERDRIPMGTVPPLKEIWRGRWINTDFIVAVTGEASQDGDASVITLMLTMAGGSQIPVEDHAAAQTILAEIEWSSQENTG